MLIKAAKVFADHIRHHQQFLSVNRAEVRSGPTLAVERVMTSRSTRHDDAMNILDRDDIAALKAYVRAPTGNKVSHHVLRKKASVCGKEFHALPIL